MEDTNSQNNAPLTSYDNVSWLIYVVDEPPLNVNVKLMAFPWFNSLY